MTGLRQPGAPDGQPTLPEPDDVILGAEIARRYLVSGSPVRVGTQGVGFRATDLLSRQPVFAELYATEDARTLATNLGRGIPLEGQPVAVLADSGRVLVLRRPFRGVQHIDSGFALGTALLHARHEATHLGLHQSIDPTELVLDRGRPRLASVRGLTESDSGQPLAEILVRLDERFAELVERHGGDVAAMAHAHAGLHRMEAWADAPPLVGVTKLVNRIEGRLTTGGAESMVLGGPAGVGKSRTLDELRRRLARRGLRVATVRAADHCDGPLLLWSAASTASPEDRGVLEEVRARLTAMPGLSPEWLEDPTVAGGPTPRDLDLDGRHRRYCRVLAECILELLTARGDGVLLIDDADLLDASCQAILAEIRSLDAREQRLAIVATAREPERVSPDIAVSHLSVPGLDANALEALIDATVHRADLLPHLADRLIAQVGPRPLHLWAWIRYLSESGLLWCPEQAENTALVDLQQRRLTALGDTARQVLEVCALHPELWDRTDLASLLQLTQDQVSEAMAELRGSGLAVGSGHRAVRIAHATAVACVESCTDGERLRERHHALARWLARSGTATSHRVTRHRELGTAPGASAELCEEHLDATETALGTYDLVAARWHLERAAERAPGPSHTRRVQRKLAHVDLLSNRTEAAQSAYLDLLQGAPPEEALALAREVMYGFYRRNATDAAMAIGRRSLLQAGEWVPHSSLGLGLATVWTLIHRRREPAGLRDALAAVYTLLVPLAAANQPGLLVLAIWRARRLAHDLATQWGASANALAGMFLSMSGLRQRGEVALDEAAQAATLCGAPRALGEVAHLKGQVLLSYGEYDAGQRSLAEAIEQFERAGDMTIGAISLYLRADFGVHREPDAVLRRWIHQADDAARRQGNQLVRPSLAALLLYVDVRAGRDVGGRFASVRHRLDNLDPSALDAVVGRAWFALALYQAGAIDEAHEASETAVLGMEQGPGSLELTQSVYLADALIHRDERRGSRAIRQLEKLGKHSPRARAGAAWARAERALRQGRHADARRRARDLVACDAYGEIRLLPRLVEILHELGDDATPSPAALDALGEMVQAPVGSREPSDDLHPLLSSLRELVAPRPITIDVSELHSLDPAATSIVLLTAMAIRDQTAGEVTVRLATRNTVDGLRTMVDISGGGARQTAPLGLSGVRQAVEALGGYLSVGPSLSMRRVVVELPPGRTDAGAPLIAVVHDDPRVQQSLEEAVRSLGYRLGEPRAAVLTLTNQPSTAGRVLRVVPRSERGPGDLAFPFGLGELAEALHTAVGPSSSAREQHQ